MDWLVSDYSHKEKSFFMKATHIKFWLHESRWVKNKRLHLYFLTKTFQSTHQHCVSLLLQQSRKY
jgi:hypothetical protein